MSDVNTSLRSPSSRSRAQRLGLRHALAERERRVLADRVGHGRVDQRVERLVAELGEHRRLLRRRSGRCGGRRTSRARQSRSRPSVTPLGSLASEVGPAAFSGRTPPLSRNLRDSLARGRTRRPLAFPVGETRRAGGAPSLLSRGASLRRFGCLRVSGEGCSFGARGDMPACTPRVSPARGRRLVGPDDSRSPSERAGQAPATRIAASGVSTSKASVSSRYSFTIDASWARYPSAAS